MHLICICMYVYGLGSMLTEFSTELLTFALDEVTQQNMTRATRVLTRLSHLKFLHSDAAWYIDSEIDMPYVEALLNYLYFNSSTAATSANSESETLSNSNNDNDDEEENVSVAASIPKSDIKKNGIHDPAATTTAAVVTNQPASRVRIHHSLSTGLEYEVETTENSDSNNNKPLPENTNTTTNNEDEDEDASETDPSEGDELESVVVSHINDNDEEEDALNISNVAEVDKHHHNHHNTQTNTKTKMKTDRNTNTRPKIDKTHHKQPDFEILYRNALKEMTDGNRPWSDTPDLESDMEQLKLKQQQLIIERRLERREYLNYEHFKTYLKSWVPSVCSLCFRSTSFTIDILSSQTVEKMISQEAQKLVNSSSQMRMKMRSNDRKRYQDQQQLQAHDGNNMLGGIKIMKHTYYSILLDMIQNFRDNNEYHRQSQLQTLASVAGLPAPLADSLVNLNDRKVHLDLPGLELVLIKRLKPVQDLFIRLLGVEMKIPLNEHILFELVALMLQRNHPHFV